MSFCHLHLHSEFSLLDGANRIDELVEKAVEMEQPAIAITDHGTVAGSISFIKGCQDKDVKPIIGSEVYITLSTDITEPSGGSGDNFHLTLLAQNEIGFRNLTYLVSESNLQGFHHRPRMNKSMLAKHSEGLIVLTGCIGAELPHLITMGETQKARDLLDWYNMIFDDRIFIEVMYHGEHQGVDHTRIEDDDGSILIEEGQLNDELFHLAEKFDIPVVSTNDAHYLHEQDGDHHDTLICKGKGKFDPVRKFRFPGAEHGSHEFYVKSAQEMVDAGARWGDRWERACRQTVDVASMIDMDVVPLNQNIIPRFDIPRDGGFNLWKATGEL